MFNGKSNTMFAMLFVVVLFGTALAQAATITALPQDTYRVATLQGDVACGATAANDILYTARLIEVDVGSAMLGGGTGVLPNAVNKVLIDPVGWSYANSATPYQNVNASAFEHQPIVFWKVPGRDCYNGVYFNFGSNPSSMIRFDAIGDGNTPGYITMGRGSSSDAPYTSTYIGIFEYGPSLGATAIPLYISPTVTQFKQTGASGTIYYTNGDGTGYQPHGIPPTFTTNRGIVFTSLSTTQVVFNTPNGAQNLPPVVSSIGGPSTLSVGQTGTWSITATDPENGALTYSVNWGDSSSGTPKQTASFTHSYSQAGSYTVSFTVTDSAGASAQSTISVAVTGTTPQNQPPHITGGMAPPSLTVGQAGAYSVSAYDPEGGPLTYTTTWGDGTSSGPQSSSSFTHSYSQVGTYNIEFKVFDSAGASDQVGAQTTVTGTTQTPCVDYDNGQNIYVASYGKGNYAGSGSVGDEWIIGADGTTSAQPSPYGYSIVYDHCANSNLIEAYCTADGKLGSMGTDCPAGYVCSNGACVATSQQVNLLIERVWMEADPNNAGSYTVYSKVTVNGQPASINDVAVTYTMTDANGATYTSNVAGSCQNSAYCQFNYFGMNYGAGVPCGSMKVTVDAKYIGLAASSNRPEATKTETFTRSPPYCTPANSKLEQVSVSIGMQPPEVSEGSSVLISTKVSRDSPKASAKSDMKSYMVVTTFDKPMPDYAAGASELSARSKDMRKVDYIKLRPGETSTLNAYFSPDSDGIWEARSIAYENNGGCKDGLVVDLATCQQVGQRYSTIEVSSPPQPPVSYANIEFHVGWNMVAAPIGQKISMSDVAAKCNTQQHAWELTENGYVKKTTIEPGVGYWVKSYGECKFQVPASLAAKNAAFSRKLFSGWNLVGAPASPVSMQDNYGDCQIKSGPWYYQYGQNSISYAASTSLEPGRAYWIKVAAACTLGASDMPPAPPS